MTAMEHAHTYIDPAMENVLKEGRSVMEGWDTEGMETGQCENHRMMSVSERWHPRGHGF